MEKLITLTTDSFSLKLELTLIQVFTTKEKSHPFILISQ